jgi:hypothetical protein
VLVIRSDSDQFGDDDDDNNTFAKNKLKSEIKMIFQMELVPVDDQSRRWSLRCDTEEELDAWLEVMQEVSPGSFDQIAPSNDA